MPLASMSFRQKIEEDRTRGAIDIRPWQDILAGVEELHRLGLVHRDLKPENILLVESTWVLSDFGLVLPSARETTILTGTNSAYGSHLYAAPEQAQDFRNTPEQADIFALGCILHDSVGVSPQRVPFAQIRMTGPYGLLLEKCTEAQPRRRVQDVQSLRGLLFEVWRTSQASSVSLDETSLLKAVQAEPSSGDCWRALIAHIEDVASRNDLLKAIDSPLIEQLHAVDDVLFGRMVDMLNDWAAGTGFVWEYCDVVGDRLKTAFKLSPVRLRCGIALAALELAVSHNRWHVMRQVGNMLDSDADSGLVDRIIMEADLGPGIAWKFHKIEKEIDWRRESWHPKLVEYLSKP